MSRQLRLIGRSLLSSKIIPEYPQIISKARVPVAKTMETRSTIPIDISYGHHHGIEAAEMIKDWIRQDTRLKPLVLVLKQYLKSRSFNEVWTGGIGGFSTVCWMRGFLKIHDRIISNRSSSSASSLNVDNTDNSSGQCSCLGTLLLDFFRLFAYAFDYHDLVLDPIHGLFYRKEDYGFQNKQKSFLLSIMDPLNQSNDLTRGGTQIRSIVNDMDKTFQYLKNTQRNHHGSLLASLMRWSEVTSARRKMINKPNPSSIKFDPFYPHLNTKKPRKPQQSQPNLSKNRAQRYYGVKKKSSTGTSQFSHVHKSQKNKKKKDDDKKRPRKLYKKKRKTENTN